MTYSVKNGTWCKDNNKEYYSTTKAGLKAALAAGEITAGTKVVIHEPKYHAGQLIQSLNPNCPEGCFVPHGQAFNKSIYEELAKVFPSGVLPDMRECVMVCAGQNTHITTHKHDVFNAGEFKDDCSIKHSHTITVTDPGHNHTVNISDPGHTHVVNISDPGHNHTVNISDPGHKHTVNISDPGHKHSVSDPGHTHNVTGSTDKAVFSSPGAGQNVQYDPYYGNLDTGATVNISGTAKSNTTNISIDSVMTGISASSDNNTTGISASSDNNTTGISASSDNNTTGITASSNKGTTGITASCSTAGATGATVTRTKQFGVYYYIAF